MKYIAGDLNKLKNKSGIYCIRNKETGECYIGSSVALLHRYRQHMFNLSRGKFPNRALYSAWKDSPPDCFVFEVLEFCDKEKLSKVEQEWIDVWWDDGILYNKTRIVPIKRASNGRCVDCYTLDGNYIESFDTIRSASIAYKIRISQITWVCQGKHRQSGGFLWTYKGNDPVVYDSYWGIEK